MLYTYIDILHRKCYFICRRKKITDKVDEEFSMLRKFKVRNYKNFKETLEFDFTKVSGYAFNRECVNSEIISKCIIYGRNATGKTNLGKAFSDLTEIVEGRIHLGRNERILNADLGSCYNDKYDKKILLHICYFICIFLFRNHFVSNC